MLKRLTLATALSLLTTAANADISYKQYVQLTAMKEAGQAKHGHGAMSLDYWLDGVATGISWAYAAEPNRSGKVFCLPTSLAITGDVVNSAIRQLLEENPGLKADENRMGALAISAVKRAFPCTK